MDVTVKAKKITCLLFYMSAFASFLFFFFTKIDLNFLNHKQVKMFVLCQYVQLHSTNKYRAS